MFNKIVIAGRLVADPELKFSEAGVARCSFRIAVDRPFKQNGERVADFFSVTAWRATAEFVANQLGKGQRAIVEGRMQSTQSEKDGQKRTFWDVQADNVQVIDWPEKKDEGGDEASDDEFADQG